MSTNTENLNLKKPAQEDFYNVDDFSENFQKIDDFSKRKDNPHSVTPEQIGAVNKAGDQMTDNLDIKKAKRPSVRFKVGDKYSAGIYKDADDNTNYDYGFLIRDCADASKSVDEYLELKISHRSINEGKKRECLMLSHHLDAETVRHYGIYGEHNKPTADDVRAIPSTSVTPIAQSENDYDLNLMVTTGFYRIVSENTNTPVTPRAGHLLMVIPWDANTVVQIYIVPEIRTTKFCVRTKMGGVWQDWNSELLTTAGGTLTGQLLALNGGMGRVYADGANIALTACDEPNDTSNRRTFFVCNSKFAPNNDNALILRDVIENTPTDYKIFGQHNKPTGSYIGNYTSGQTIREVITGGLGNGLLLWEPSYPQQIFLVTPCGAMFVNSGTVNGLMRSQCYFENGVLYLSQNICNAEGHTYTYQVL